MTLEQKILRDALPGFSKVDCPGGFVAYVAKRDDGKNRVEYVHSNTHQEIHRITHNRVRALAIGV